MKRDSSRLAVIMHADIAGSTTLVQKDEQLAHSRIRTTFERFAVCVRRYHGRVRELRGDALLAQFERASDAVSAALRAQREHTDACREIDDDIVPTVRVGIAMGEVVIADNTITGSGVVMAQRIEQLVPPGGVGLLRGTARGTVAHGPSKASEPECPELVSARSRDHRLLRRRLP